MLDLHTDDRKIYIYNSAQILFLSFNMSVIARDFPMTIALPKSHEL